MLDSVEIHKDPYGVVLIFGAWNYPLQLSLAPVAGAIAAGNCVIIKPSEVASASAKFMAATIPKYLDNVSIVLCYFRRRLKGAIHLEKNQLTFIVSSYFRTISPLRPQILCHAEYS